VCACVCGGVSKGAKSEAESQIGILVLCNRRRMRNHIIPAAPGSLGETSPAAANAQVLERHSLLRVL
jgi:hypothetical protein